MIRVVRNLIEYSIDECSCIKAQNFKQSNVDFIVAIPCDNISIEKILRVWVNPTITYKKILNTLVGISLEGQQLTGNGILLEGDLNVKIEYVGGKEKQSTYTNHFTTPFCSYIILPKLFNLNTLVTPSIFIEDIDVKLLSEKTIYCNITLMAVADIC